MPTWPTPSVKTASPFLVATCAPRVILSCTLKLVSISRADEYATHAYGEQINVETFFELNDEQRANWRTDKPNMVLANGDVTGATFHGDFVNAWDTAKLARAIKECTGGVDDCPVLFKENENLDLADCRLEVSKLATPTGPA